MPTVAVNAAWHNQHRMPRNASLDERVAWHLEHREHCACRPVPAKLLAQIDKRGLADGNRSERKA